MNSGYAGITPQSHITYLAANVEQVTDPEKAVGEKTEADKMTWEEIEKAIESGTINQVFSVLALKLAEDYIREKTGGQIL